MSIWNIYDEIEIWINANPSVQPGQHVRISSVSTCTPNPSTISCVYLHDKHECDEIEVNNPKRQDDIINSLDIRFICLSSLEPDGEQNSIVITYNNHELHLKCMLF